MPISQGSPCPAGKSDVPAATISRRAAAAGGAPVANILMAQALANPDIISLAAGFVEHDSLPVEEVAQAVQAILSRRDVALASLQYGSTIGFPPLRQAIVDRLAAAEGRSQSKLGASMERVVVTAGSNQLLHLILDALLDPGDIVLCGSPTYFVFLGIVQNLRGRAVGVETDAEGMIPEALEERLAWLARRGELDRVKAIYIASYCDNPTGITLAESRRPQIVDLARRWSRTNKIRVLEDAAYRDLQCVDARPPSLRSYDDGDCVVLLGTFSKSFSPGIRVGWGLLPADLLPPVLALKGNLDFGSPQFNQMVVFTALENGGFDSHVEGLRRRYRAKIELTAAALEQSLRSVVPIDYVKPSGGLYVWVRLPPGFDTGIEGDFFQACVQEGVLFLPGESCFPDEGNGVPKNCIRISYSMPSPDGLRRGIAAMGRAAQRIRETASESPGKS
ncbi:aminotransferase-like domain-containing protein [Thermopirellula anaerolimosa]